MLPDRPSDPGADQGGDRSLPEPSPTRRRRSSGRLHYEETWVPGVVATPDGNGAGVAAFEVLVERGERANSLEPADADAPEQGDDDDDDLTLDEPDTVDELGYELYVDEDEEGE
jgi:hypothetical protein